MTERNHVNDTVSLEKPSKILKTDGGDENGGIAAAAMQNESPREGSFVSTFYEVNFQVTDFIDCQSLRSLAVSCKALHQKALYEDRGCFRAEPDLTVPQATAARGGGSSAHGVQGTKPCRNCSIFRCFGCALPQQFRCQYCDCTTDMFDLQDICTGWCKDKKKCSKCNRLQYRCRGSCMTSSPSRPWRGQRTSCKSSLSPGSCEIRKWPQKIGRACTACQRAPVCEEHLTVCEECEVPVSLCKSCLTSKGCEKCGFRDLCFVCSMDWRHDECINCRECATEEQFGAFCRFCHRMTCKDCAETNKCQVCGRHLCWGCNSLQGGRVCRRCRSVRAFRASETRLEESEEDDDENEDEGSGEDQDEDAE
uniref:Uncharacterized protein n=1 Tax=Chromera velia CCMP2878 TaxID=1169474 RepID=A0A0G4G6Y7_9ALVE|eukprot:Cvel_20545.t1-p1 / transcript=Cvel_20545.t1 / gene=Cvel_20545 / organism=Chromera_velia_CCMP2878 / gene_product=hypothetical protein / transcript_product=hypothetical protein / location=Cvel_scaffold1854:6365-7456(+) / protein_length=364 / sequence_SO=supercontig / SO=protein_coding / is_pseudo=false